MDGRLVEQVCAVLEAAGFHVQAHRGVTVCQEGTKVVVRWQPNYSLLRPAINSEHPAGPQRGYGQGSGAVMNAALAAVLEQGGFDVGVDQQALIVAGAVQANPKVVEAAPDALPA